MCCVGDTVCSVSMAVGGTAHVLVTNEIFHYFLFVHSSTTGHRDSSVLMTECIVVLFSEELWTNNCFDPGIEYDLLGLT